MFNWEEYFVAIIKRNYIECREKRQAIKFPYLLIWIVMGHFNPVGEPTFKPNKIQAMENYRVFSPGVVGLFDSLPTDGMF
jgi:hypothetical protein